MSSDYQNLLLDPLFTLLYEQILICSYIAAHNALVLKAESMVDKNEWINKLQKVIQARGGQVGSASMRQSLSEGSLVSNTRKLS